MMKQVVVSFITVILAFLLPLIYTPILLILGAYRLVVFVTLKVIHRGQFGGMLRGPDAMWTVQDVSKSLIHILVTITSSRSADDFVETTRHVIFTRCLEQQPKLSYIRRKFLGYSFFLKHSFSSDECIKVVTVDGVVTDEYIEDFVDGICHNDMPFDDSGVFEVFIFSPTVSNRFRLLFRMDHCVGDGISLINFFVHNFSGRNVSNYTRLWHDSQLPRPSILSCFWKAFYGTASVMVHTAMRPLDESMLHGVELSGESTLVWRVEKEELLVPLIKMARNKLPGTRFSEVVLAAISESFKDFYFKKLQPPPQFLTCVVPRPITRTSQINLKNKFSVAMLSLPITTRGDILDTLGAVKAQTGILRDSPDYMVNYWLLTLVCSVFPEPLLKPLIYSAHSTMCVSILPGMQKLSVLEGDILEDVVFWIPLRGSTGIGVSVLTYDSRLQIGLTVDKAILSNQADLDGIVDGVFTHILRLYKTLYGNM